jgi:hypothetical protein
MSTVGEISPQAEGLRAFHLAVLIRDGFQPPPPSDFRDLTRRANHRLVSIIGESARKPKGCGLFIWRF